MSGVKWYFDEVRPNPKNREPMHSKFFEADRTITSSLIRESIQNSLDAKSNNINDENQNKKPVHVRIFFSGTNGALSYDQIEPYFTNEAWRHFGSQQSGLRNCPQNNESCQFVVIEDFNTTGLNGDIRQYVQTDNKANPFYYFFRTEGQSPKHQTDRGRHGIGKIVFPKASRIKTFFALTVRSEDNQKFLFGQTLLKHHELERKYYTSDGWMGLKENINDGFLPMPICNNEYPEIIDGFAHIFNLNRDRNPGLSLVIPYVENEISYEDILRAVIEDYFWPVLTGDLYVTVESPENTYNLDAGSLLNISNHAFNIDKSKETISQIKLAQWAIDVPNEKYINIKCPEINAPPKWEEDIIDLDLRNQIRINLETENRIAIFVPVIIRDKFDNEDKNSFFKIFLQRSKDPVSGYPVFIREGIIIPDRKHVSQNQGILALVIADDPPIADFLGNAENPAHTEWSTQSDNFKDRYIYGSNLLSFIKKSIGNIIRIAEGSSKQKDKTLLLDYFSIPVLNDEIKRPDIKSKNGSIKGISETDIDVDIEPKPKRYRLNKVNGGFTITKGEQKFSLPARLEIKTYYDRRGGKAKYDRNDFRIEKLKAEHKGLKIIQTRDNVFVANIIKEDFFLTIKGFDQNRDILVKPSISVFEQEIENAEI